ncbi:MAG: hypothetical protein AB7O98_05110 [Hyphomonadaceae bacterium]
MTWRVILAAIAAFALSSCVQPLDAQDGALIASAVERVRAGDTSSIYEQLADELQTEQGAVALEQLHEGLVVAGEPCTRSFIDASTFEGKISLRGAPLRRRTNARHLYTCSNATYIVTAHIFSEDGGPRRFETLQIRFVDPAAARAAQAFELRGQSLRHYAFLAVAILSPLLMLMALAGVLFTKGFKRKWLWGVIALAGIGKFSLVWPTAEIVTQLISINFIGFGIMRGVDPLAPWVVSFTPPLGAVIALSLLWPRWLADPPADEAGP